MRPIRKKKKKAREMRNYAHYVKGQEPGTTSTHLMVSEIKDVPKGETYKVWPSITTTKEGWDPQTKEQAEQKGEIFEFKRKGQAKRFAKGSWKTRAIKKGKYYTHGGIIQHD